MAIGLSPARLAPLRPLEGSRRQLYVPLALLALQEEQGTEHVVRGADGGRVSRLATPPPSPLHWAPSEQAADSASYSCPCFEVSTSARTHVLGGKATAYLRMDCGTIMVILSPSPAPAAVVPGAAGQGGLLLWSACLASHSTDLAVAFSSRLPHVQ